MYMFFMWIVIAKVVVVKSLSKVPMFLSPFRKVDHDVGSGDALDGEVYPLCTVNSKLVESKHLTTKSLITI